MTERDQEEQDLRIDQMTINIEKLRQDMAWESRKFVLQMIATIAGTIVATVAATTLILHLLGRV